MGAEHTESTLVPGLVDIHCHGYRGMDVMQGAASEIGAELRKLGIEWYCPTTVTAPWEDIRRALQPCRAGFDGFAGVHLEGPYINSEMAGAQPRSHITPPSLKEMSDELGEDLRLLKIITLAPELDGASEIIANRDGIIISAGHTKASFEQLGEAAKLGLEHMTHFYNAMGGFHHRNPGAVGFGLTTPVFCEVIYDEVHVSKPAMQLLLNSRGLDGVFGISDGTMLSGTEEGAEAEMWGRTAVNKGGCAALLDGTLAGSASTLVDIFRNIWRDFGAEAAIRTCSLNARRRLRLPPAEVWIVVDQTGSPEEVMKGGFS